MSWANCDWNLTSVDKNDAWSVVKSLPIKELLHWKQSDQTSQRLAAINEIANRQYVCEPCGLEFKYRSYYKLHLNSKKHRYTIEPPEWKCKDCNVSFRYESKLIRHMNSQKHLGKPNVFCELCKYKASCLSQFNIHLATKKHLNRL